MALIVPEAYEISDITRDKVTIDIRVNNNNFRGEFIPIADSQIICLGSRYYRDESIICSVIIFFFAILFLVSIIQLSLHFSS